jgi:predicted RNA-binding protein with PUA-like domain
MNYWLLKSEPDVFSIDDLMQRPGRTEPWEGVRNYQARNMLRDDIKKGDLAFFYHSSCKIPAIAGIIEIIRKGYPDPTAFIPNHRYYDSRSKVKAPVWYAVDVQFRKKFKRAITLTDLREQRPLKKMQLLQKGNRLSVLPVTKKEWDYILRMQ